MLEDWFVVPGPMCGLKSLEHSILQRREREHAQTQKHNRDEREDPKGGDTPKMHPYGPSPTVTSSSHSTDCDRTSAITGGSRARTAATANTRPINRRAQVHRTPNILKRPSHT